MPNNLELSNKNGWPALAADTVWSQVKAEFTLLLHCAHAHSGDEVKPVIVDMCTLTILLKESAFQSHGAAVFQDGWQAVKV